MNPRAQGTIEYLVIIGVVVVLALVVVVLIAGQSSQSSAVSEKTLKLAWASKPVRVLDFAVDANGAGKIVFVNSLSEKITLTGFSINGTSFTQNQDLVMGDQKVLSFAGATECEGEGGEYLVDINYLSENNLEKNVSGEFYTTCLGTLLPENQLSLSLDDASFEGNTNFVSGYLMLLDSLAVNTNDLDNFLDGSPDANLSVSGTEITLGVN